MWNFIREKKSPISRHAWKMRLIRVTKYGHSSYLFADGAVTKEVAFLEVQTAGWSTPTSYLLSRLQIEKWNLVVLFAHPWKMTWKWFIVSSLDIYENWWSSYWGLTKIPATSKVKQDLPSITMFQDILKYATIYIFLGILSDEEIIQWIKIIFHNLWSIFFTFSFILSTTEPHLWYMH